MYIKILLNYIFGYVRISIEGYFIERFINICINNHLVLWNTKRKKQTIVYTNVGIKEFKQIRQIARKTKCKVNIKAKKGLPFIFNKYKKRKIFFAFLIVILILILITSNFIWNIEIVGGDEQLKNEIILDLEENGLSLGKYKNNIDTKQIVHNLRLKRSDLAWVGINIEGTNAIVEIVEAEQKPELVEEDEYCNIVSNKEGIITKISAQNGTPLVKEGDIIRNGTILIGGWLEGKFTGTRYVHALGQIEAKVWYSAKEKIYLNQQIRSNTGNTEKKYSININNFKINLYKTLSKFKIYDTINTTKKLKLFTNFYLPIEITEIVNNEVELTEIEYSYEQAKQIGIEKLTKTLDEQVENKGNIVNKQINTYENEGFVEIEIIYEVVEAVGTEEKIVF